MFRGTEENSQTSPGSWRAVWRRGFRVVLEAFFPVGCLGCGQEGSEFCSTCQARIKAALRQGCPVCGQGGGVVAGITCGPCRSKTALAGLTVLCEGEGAMIRHLIRHYRLPGTGLLAKGAIQSWLAQCLKQGRERLPAIYQKAPCLVVPEKKSWWKRGRGEGSALVQLLKAAGYQVVPGLAWQGRAVAQRLLTKEERQKNVAGKLVATGPVALGLAPPRPLVLFDDVFTTGATMREAARALRAAGWQDIWGLVLYREW